MLENRDYTYIELKKILEDSKKILVRRDGVVRFIENKDRLLSDIRMNQKFRADYYTTEDGYTIDNTNKRVVKFKGNEHKGLSFKVERLSDVFMWLSFKNPDSSITVWDQFISIMEPCDGEETVYVYNVTFNKNTLNVKLTLAKDIKYVRSATISTGILKTYGPDNRYSTMLDIYLGVVSTVRHMLIKIGDDRIKIQNGGRGTSWSANDNVIKVINYDLSNINVEYAYNTCTLLFDIGVSHRILPITPKLLSIEGIEIKSNDKELFIDTLRYKLDSLLLIKKPMKLTKEQTQMCKFIDVDPSSLFTAYNCFGHTKLLYRTSNEGFKEYHNLNYFISQTVRYLSSCKRR